MERSGHPSPTPGSLTPALEGAGRSVSHPRRFRAVRESPPPPGPPPQRGETH